MLITLLTAPVLIDLIPRARVIDTVHRPRPVPGHHLTTCLGVLTLLTLLAMGAQAPGPTEQHAANACEQRLVVYSAHAVSPAEDRAPIPGIVATRRSISAVLVAGAQNFNDPDVLVMMIVGALLVMVALVITGGEIGRRHRGR
ncbi:MAG: hypothetical protein GF331_23170 [Chitinivibrionales bacterium]|nr:hypothetical protein [Chitinivibrionales bacterium]